MPRRQDLGLVDGVDRWLPRVHGGKQAVFTNYNQDYGYQSRSLSLSLFLSTRQNGIVSVVRLSSLCSLKCDTEFVHRSLVETLEY